MKPMLYWLRRVALMLLVACVGLALLTARAVEKGEAAVLASDRAFDQGRLQEAAHHARQAAVHYAPGAPHLRAAYERLRAVAVGAEAAGDRDTARFAWNAMRSSVLETRHVRVAFPEELAAANRALARLEVQGDAPVSRRERLLQIKIAERDLSQAAGTRTGWIALLTLGFVVMMLGLAGLSLGGAELRGRAPSTATRSTATRSSATRSSATRSSAMRPWALGASGLVTLLGAACWAWAVVSA